MNEVSEASPAQAKPSGLERLVRRLPDDVARCAGSGSDEEGWREGCDVCLRRLSSSDGEWVFHMLAPPIIVVECEFLIDA